MTSKWKVPPAPASRGPFGLSSVYLFNGLEDGGGHHGNASLILQPVLQFGKSGCLLNPTQWGSWHAGSYLVDGNGRAHCGKNFQVEENETVIGTMEQTSSESNTWTVSMTAESNNQTSTYASTLNSKVLNAAYLTLEGMIIYNCKIYPNGGGTTFDDVRLMTKDGGAVQSPTWTPEIRHSECGQAVSVVSSEQVELKWDSTK
jgi:hypothetical protein